MNKMPKEVYSPSDCLKVADLGSAMRTVVICPGGKGSREALMKKDYRACPRDGTAVFCKTVKPTVVEFREKLSCGSGQDVAIKLRCAASTWE